MDSLPVAKLRQLVNEKGLTMPAKGTGKNGAIVKQDLLDLLNSTGTSSQKSSASQKPSSANISDSYNIVKELGAGQYGKVYLATSKKTGNPVAIKQIGIQHLELAKREYSIKKNFGCLERVLCYQDMVVSKDHVYLIMDYLEGMDMADVLSKRARERKPFSVKELIVMYEQLLSGLEALHSKNIAHMDIKAENVRSTLGGMVIIDLGMTCSLVSAPKCDVYYSKGTPESWSPEMAYEVLKVIELGSDADLPKMSPKEFLSSDIWAMGLLFKTMAELNPVDMAHVPFTDDKEDYIENWSQVNIPARTRTPCEALNNLVDSMLTLRYQDRPTAKQLLDKIRRIKC